MQGGHQRACAWRVSVHVHVDVGMNMGDACMCVVLCRACHHDVMRCFHVLSRRHVMHHHALMLM